MSKDTAELLAAISATAVAVMAIIGAGVRVVLLPWLREHLVGPLLERLDTLTDRLEDMTRDQHVAASMFEGHISRSGDEWSRMWDAITELRNHLPRRHRRRHREDNHHE